MSNTSRRGLVASAAAAVFVKPAFSAIVPLPVYTVPSVDTRCSRTILFADLDTMMTPYPNAFNTLNGSPCRSGPDVLVLCDYSTPMISAGLPPLQERTDHS